MKMIHYPPRDSWAELLRRPSFELDYLESSVRNVLTRVKQNGDEAICELTYQFDKVKLPSTQVTEKEIVDAESAVSPDLKKAIATAFSNISKFHESQKFDSVEIETTPGVVCWRKAVPIEKVGIYIPGGSAPLFSTVLMLGIPAVMAGCREIIMCTPPQSDGTVDPAILYTAKVVGVSKIFKVGGAQAIAAFAYGTATIPPVYKIFGPGNQYVTKAKQMVNQEGMAIDLPAGPSELMIISDETSHVPFVAADLLSQAEHGEDSQVVFITTNREILDALPSEIESQLAKLPRKEIASKALRNSLAILVATEKDAIDICNEYAPEHLIIHMENSDAIADKITNAGSVFLGSFAPESVGDYASGTNHTLPTNGFAKAYSGVSLESFIKYITFQKLSKRGIAELGPSVERMAEAENLTAHKESVAIRLRSL